MKDFEYFIENKQRYTDAIPIMKERIKNSIDSKSDMRKTIALCIELGRLVGVIQCLTTYKKYFRKIIRFTIILSSLSGSLVGYLIGVALIG